MAHVKIRHLPDGASKFRRSDMFVVAQSSGGDVTRRISADDLAGSLYTAGTNIVINSSGVISVDDNIQSQIDSLRLDFDNFKASVDSDISSLKTRMTQAESKITAVENKPAKEHAFVDMTYTYFGSSSNIGSAYVSTAQNLYKTLPNGSTLDILWYRYWTWGTGNGSAAASKYFLWKIGRAS